MDRSPLFSVIISSYNYGRYIEDAVDSVLSQTLQEHEREVIVVDDGSVDDSRERLLRYGGKINCVFKTNEGQASALNTGFEKASGKIVAFLDSDDLWHPEKLRLVAEEFQKGEGVDFVCHFMEVVDDGRRPIDRYFYPEPEGPGGEYRRAFLGGRLPWFSPTSGMSVSAECLRRVFPIPENFRIYPDIYLHYALPFYLRGLSLIKRPLGYFRVHGANASGEGLSRGEDMERRAALLLAVKDQLDRHAGLSGVSADLLKAKIDSVIALYHVLGCNAAGRKLEALKRAFGSGSVFPGGSAAGIAGRARLVVSSVVPVRLYFWLQKEYRRLLYEIRWKRRGGW